MLPLSRARTLAAALAAALVLGACDDAPVTAPPDRPARLGTGSPPLRDRDIDFSDTWLVTEATTTTTSTVEYAQPTYDPATGRTVSSVELPAVVEARRTEAGYGADGTIRINEYYAGDPVSSVAHVLIVGDSVTYFDTAGVARADLPGAALVATLGSFRNDVVTDSVILPADGDPGGGDGGGGESEPTGDGAERSPAPAYSVAGAARRDRLELSAELDDVPGSRGRRMRTYRRTPDGWVLDEERFELRREAKGSATTLLERTRYHHVAWHNDRARDRMRREHGRRAAGDARPGAGAASLRTATGTFAGGVLADGTLARADQRVLPVAPALDGALLPPRAMSGPGEGATARLGGTKFGSAPFGVVLQHGALSSASTWSRMAPALLDGFNVDVMIRESTDWRKELEGQARDLHGRLAASGRRDFLVIGHSNGGLVARRAAQLSAAAGDSLVRGVVTIGSGHAGVPLARVGRETVEGFMTSQLRAVGDRIGGSCWRGQFAWLCDISGATSAELPGRVATYALDALVPMSRDVQPGSAFLATLNGAPEAFRRYSIETASQGQWKFLRLFGDWLCDPGQSCSGNSLQNVMESVYEVLRVCGSNTIMRVRLGAVSDKCRDVRWTLSALNSQYERWTAPGDDSDGLVPLRSQLYPGLPGEQHILKRNARESHSGELKSVRVQQDLATLVKHYLTH